MAKPLTVKDLLEACIDEVKRGNSDKVIMISDDEEGNGYHYLWYNFIEVKEYEKEEELFGMKVKVTVDSLDENIAKREDTILLG